MIERTTSAARGVVRRLDEMEHRRAVVLVTVLAVVTTLGALWVKSWCGIPGSAHDLYLRWCYSDIPPLFHSEKLDVGAVPYLGHPVEYPVLTGLWMWLAGLPASSAASFLAWTAPLLLLSSAVTAWLLADEFGPSRALAFAIAPTLLVSGAVNWDLPAVALMTAGIVAHRRGLDGWAGMWLGLGTAAKLFPGLLLVPIVLAVWRLRGSESGLRTGLAAVGTWTFVNAPVMIAAPLGWFEFLRLSRERPSDWDAIWTVLSSHTAFDVSTPTLNLLTLALFVLIAGRLVWLAVRRTPPATWHLVGLPLMAWFLLSSKVYSPQFTVWLLPLFVMAWPGLRWWGAFVVADLLVTATRFPYLANFVGDGIDGAWPQWPYHSAIVLRWVLLLVVAMLGWRRGVGQIWERHVASHDDGVHVPTEAAR